MGEPDLETTLRDLETSLWVEATRFDPAYMERVLAPDFFEFGRSGRVYDRAATLAAPRQPIGARLPLRDFRVHPVSEDVVLVSYISEVVDSENGELLVGNRSSLWRRETEGWKLVFHQGTPVTD